MWTHVNPKRCRDCSTSDYWHKWRPTQSLTQQWNVNLFCASKRDWKRGKSCWIRQDCSFAPAKEQHVTHRQQTPTLSKTARQSTNQSCTIGDIFMNGDIFSIDGDSRSSYYCGNKIGNIVFYWVFVRKDQVIRYSASTIFLLLSLQKIIPYSWVEFLGSTHPK